MPARTCTQQLISILWGLSLLVVASLSETAKAQDVSRTLRAPFEVSVRFIPSGFMGDWQKVRVEGLSGPDCAGFDNPDNACLKIDYTPGVKGWAGVYWQYPEENWGEFPGTKVTDAEVVSFWVRGATGNEWVEFKAGGIASPKQPYRDSFEVSSGRLRLTRQWRQVTMDLDGEDLSSVIGAFAWVAKGHVHPNGLTFFLDQVRYQ